MSNVIENHNPSIPSEDSVTIHDNIDKELSASGPTAVHAALGVIMGLMLTLVGLEYQGSVPTPFNTHYWVMLLFITAAAVYAIATLAEIITQRAQDDHTGYHSSKFTFICIISGSLACELLGLVLVTPFSWLVINMSAFLLVEVLRRWHHQIVEAPVGLLNPNGIVSKVMRYLGVSGISMPSNGTVDIEVGHVQMVNQT